MKYLLIILLLTGCTTVPVTAKFPEAPSELLQKCPALKQLDEEVKLSDVAKNITYNYTTYYECVIKLDAWIEWYQSQKKIFESVK
jgi:hypothetical protein